MNNVSKELMSGILFRSNASLVWSDLKERFDKVNMSRIFHLHKSIVTHTQVTSPVSVYYSKLKDLWDEFDSIQLFLFHLVIVKDLKNMLIACLDRSFCNF